GLLLLLQRRPPGARAPARRPQTLLPGAAAPGGAGVEKGGSKTEVTRKKEKAKVPGLAFPLFTFSLLLLPWPHATLPPRQGPAKLARDHPGRAGRRPRGVPGLLRLLHAVVERLVVLGVVAHVRLPDAGVPARLALAAPQAPAPGRCRGAATLDRARPPGLAADRGAGQGGRQARRRAAQLPPPVRRDRPADGQRIGPVLPPGGRGPHRLADHPRDPGGGGIGLPRPGGNG